MPALLERALTDGTLAALIALVVAVETLLLLVMRRHRLALFVMPGFGLAAALATAQRHGGAWSLGLELLAALLLHVLALVQGLRAEPCRAPEPVP